MKTVVASILSIGLVKKIQYPLGPDINELRFRAVADIDGEKVQLTLAIDEKELIKATGKVNLLRGDYIKVTGNYTPQFKLFSAEEVFTPNEEDLKTAYKFEDVKKLGGMLTFKKLTAREKNDELDNLSI